MNYGEYEKGIVIDMSEIGNETDSNIVIFMSNFPAEIIRFKKEVLGMKEDDDDTWKVGSLEMRTVGGRRYFITSSCKYVEDIADLPYAFIRNVVNFWSENVVDQKKFAEIFSREYGRRMREIYPEFYYNKLFAGFCNGTGMPQTDEKFREFLHTCGCPDDIEWNPKCID